MTMDPAAAPVALLDPELPGTTSDITFALVAATDTIDTDTIEATGPTDAPEFSDALELAGPDLDTATDTGTAPADGTDTAAAAGTGPVPETGAAALITALVGDAVNGDIQARDALLAVIHPMVLRYCRARLGRQECVIGSADDVAQDVCLAVVRALPHYRIKGLSFRAFVYGIAAHKVTDAFRAIGRNRSEPVADVPDAPVDVDGPEHRALAIELGERLSSLLHILTPRQREVIVLRIAVGLSAEETAQSVRSTPGAVRVTQHRALTRLREHLLEQEALAEAGAGKEIARPVRGARVG